MMSSILFSSLKRGIHHQNCSGHHSRPRRGCYHSCRIGTRPETSPGRPEWRRPVPAPWFQLSTFAATQVSVYIHSDILVLNPGANYKIGATPEPVNELHRTALSQLPPLS